MNRFSLRLVVALLMPGALAAAESDVIYLWGGAAPGSEGQSAEEVVRLEQAERIISQVHRPSLTVYLPPGPARAPSPALLIIPGGGHREIWTDHEGHNVARWLSARGVACFILKYRLSRQENTPYTIEHSVADAQRAVRLLRARSADWHVDPNRIGAIGFSAGGEIAIRLAMSKDAAAPDAADPIDRQSTRFAYLGLVYPAFPDLLQPTKETPPTFLCWGFNDMPMISEGMAGVYGRYRGAGVPVEMHEYSDAGHGFGVRDSDTSPAGKWIERFYDWLGERHLLNTPAAR